MTNITIIVGDKAAELSAMHALSIALIEALSRLEQLGVHTSAQWVVGPLLMAASRSLGLCVSAGPDPPIEVLALSARNTLELWLRLLHVLKSDENRQAWRNENLTDQLEIYEAILALETSDTSKDAKVKILAEVDRVTRLAASRGLSRGKKLMSVSGIAKATGLEPEYKAFYKLYSKLVHPSSWIVNSPSSVSAPMYRMTLVSKAQEYGREILFVLETAFGLSSEECYESALARLAYTKE